MPEINDVNCTPFTIMRKSSPLRAALLQASARDQVIDFRGELTYPLMTHCPRFAAEIIAGQTQSNINIRTWIREGKKDVCVELVDVLNRRNCKERFQKLNSHFLGSVRRFGAAGTRLLFSLASYRQSISTCCCTRLVFGVNKITRTETYFSCIKETTLCATTHNEFATVFFDVINLHFMQICVSHFLFIRYMQTTWSDTTHR